MSADGSEGVGQNLALDGITVVVSPDSLDWGISDLVGQAPREGGVVLNKRRLALARSMKHIEQG